MFTAARRLAGALVVLTVAGCAATPGVPPGDASSGTSRPTATAKATFRAAFGKPYAVNGVTYTSLQEAVDSSSTLTIMGHATDAFPSFVLNAEGDRILFIGVHLAVDQVLANSTDSEVGEEVTLQITGPGTVPGEGPDDARAVKAVQRAWAGLGSLIIVLVPNAGEKVPAERRSYFLQLSTQTLFAEKGGSVYAPNYPDGDDPLAREAGKYSSIKSLSSALAEMVKTR